MAIWTDIVTTTWLMARGVTWEQASNVLGLVNNYHAIPKDKIENFMSRAASLRAIHEIFQENAKKAAQGAPSRERGSKEAAILLADTATQSLRKAGYLEEAHAFMAGNGDIKDAFWLVHMLQARRYDSATVASYRSSHAGSSQTPDMILPTATEEGQVALRGNVLLEAIDPWHRPFEPGVEERTGKFVGAGTNVYNRAICEWANAVIEGRTTTPFFGYLEISEVCRPNDHAAAGKSPYDVGHQVVYDRSGYQAWRISFSFPPMREELLGSSDAGNVFDTTGRDRWRGSDKGEMVRMWLEGEYADSPRWTGSFPGGLAYVWIESNSLTVGIHKTDQYSAERYHHTTYSSGRPVFCAGMIAAVGGKIVYLSNDSGHYRPGVSQLVLLVRRLSILKALDPMALIHDASTKGTPRRLQQFMMAHRIQ